MSTASASTASGIATSPIAARSGGARSHRRTGAGSGEPRPQASTSPTRVRQPGPSGTGRSRSWRCGPPINFRETYGASKWMSMESPTCEARHSSRESASQCPCPAVMDGPPFRRSASSSTLRDGTAYVLLSAARPRNGEILCLFREGEKLDGVKPAPPPAIQRNPPGLRSA